MEFTLKVLLSFLVGGTAVSVVVWISEHLGSHIGGAIAGIPTTIFLSLAFICFTEGSKATQSSSVIVPVVILIGLSYGYVFTQVVSHLPDFENKQLGATFISALFWIIAAIVAHILFAHTNIFINVFVILVGATFAQLFLFKKLRLAKPKKIKFPKGTYPVRFLVSGIVVAAAVIAARLFGSSWGGIISTAPVIASITLYLLYKYQGAAFTEGFVKRLPLSYLSAVIFIIILHATLTHMPAYLAFLLGIGGSLIYTYTLISINKPISIVEQVD